MNEWLYYRAIMLTLVLTPPGYYPSYWEDDSTFIDNGYPWDDADDAWIDWQPEPTTV